MCHKPGPCTLRHHGRACLATRTAARTIVPSFSPTVSNWHSTLRQRSCLANAPLFAGPRHPSTSRIVHLVRACLPACHVNQIPVRARSRPVLFTQSTASGGRSASSGGQQVSRALYYENKHGVCQDVTYPATSSAVPVFCLADGTVFVGSLLTFSFSLVQEIANMKVGQAS